MVFRGRLAELMAEVAPKLYRKYIILGKNGEPLLYVKLQKALYGLLQSALLFYKKLVEDLTADGFELNPYDPCVANKMVNGKQLTVAWHVDDLKISHFEEAEVDRLITYLKSIYGDNLSEQEGPVVDYLGTHIHYPGDGTVEFSQIPYLCKIMEDFPEQINATKASPAAEYLFKVQDEAEQVSDATKHRRRLRAVFKHVGTELSTKKRFTSEATYSQMAEKVAAEEEEEDEGMQIL